MTNLDELLAKLKEHSDAIAEIVKEIGSAQSADAPKAEENPKEEPVKFEEVRAVMAEKSRAGFAAEVRALIQKYGASKFSEVKAEDYKAIKVEAEAIGNA